MNAANIKLVERFVYVTYTLKWQSSPFCTSAHQFAHNRRGPSDLKTVEISHFSALKLWFIFIFIYEHIATRTVLDF